MHFIVLIPAYKPTGEFPTFVSELIARNVSRVVVVDDGSGPGFRACFDAVRSLNGVHLCRHAINLGKGAALKTGINAILCEYPDVSVVVTADADGQHHPDDVVAVGKEAEAFPNSVVLGARSFSRDVPLRSRFGNLITLGAMRVIVGQRLTDSQTGLRALPYFLLPLLLKIRPQGYDFELDVLVRCREMRVSLREVPIKTIYLDGNKSSHFNPLLDSMRIYFVLLRFASVAMCTAVIDALVFSRIYFSTDNVIMAQVCGRLVAMVFNFATVQRFVFKAQRGGVATRLLKYVTLVAISGTVSYGLIQMLTNYLGLGVLAAKFIGEGLLFFANFLIQRDFIFTSRTEGPEELERQLRASAAAISSVGTKRE